MKTQVAAALPRLDRFGARLALFYAGFMFVLGMQVPFLPLWLQSRGLGSQEIAVVLAAPIVMRMFVTPVFSRLVDRHSDTRRALVIASFASVVGFAIIGIAEGFLQILLAFSLTAILFTPIGALADAYALTGLQSRSSGYGSVRLWGSVAFLIANLFAGALLSVIAVHSFIWAIVLGLAAMSLFAGLLAPLPARLAEPPAAAPAAVNFWRLPQFLLIAAAASLIQASHSIYYTFSAVAWTAAGLGSTAVGTLWAIGIGAEIIFFAVSARLAHRPVALIGMGAAGAFLRWTVMGLNPPVLLLPLLQCLHAFSFGATHLGSIQFAGRAAQARQSATAQADFGAVLAFGGAATTAFSGVLYGAIGGSAYLVMAGMAGTGAMLLVVAGRLRR